MDLNGDNRLDIAGTNYSRRIQLSYNENKHFTEPRYLKDSKGVFIAGNSYYDITANRQKKNPQAVSKGELDNSYFVDWDKDGDLDLLESCSTGVFLRENKGDKKTLSLSHESVAIDLPSLKPGKKLYKKRAIVAHDMNHDGLLDLVTAESGKNISLFLNSGTVDQPEFKEEQVIHSYGSISYYYFSLSVGDLNNDGKLDILLGSTIPADKAYTAGLAVFYQE